MSKRNLATRMEKVIKELRDYKRLMYTDQSNDAFDEEFDNLTYHIDGAHETFQELLYDCNHGKPFNEKGWEEDVKRNEECLRQVGAYYYATMKSPKPEYIYS